MADETVWLSVADVARFERVSRMEVYRRMQPGDPHFLISKDGREIDGKPGRLIHARSMTFDAQMRWREHRLGQAMKPDKAENAEIAASAASSGEMSLFPQTEVDKQMAALSLSESERGVVLRRYRIVDLCLNHNWKSEGYASKRQYMSVLAKRNCTTARSIQRWVAAWKEHESLIDLVADRPGPPPGSGTVLDADMRAHLRDCWVFRKLTVRQSYESLVRYLKGKQNSVGCRVDYFYPIPSYPTVARFIRHKLDALDQAVRGGPEALKAACGYIDRTYRDCKSLERVEVDEWKCDFLAYDAKRPTVVRRWWLLTFYDARSMCPLVGKLVAGSQYDPKHGIREADEIEILVRLLKEYGVPESIYSDHGRFRGKTFGGHARKHEKFDGILDRLGIRKSEPREKNPRGSRLERFHRYLADQSRTAPGWIGANIDEERKSAPGDEQTALHERWIKGDPGVPRSPLLSTDEAMQEIERWMEAWRDHESSGTDMDGLSPRAVFVHNQPEGGFRKPTDEEIAWHMAEHFIVSIREGGSVQLRDGKRYSDPQLLLIQGERREVVRRRDDHEQISVLPSAKGESVIIAKRRARVGVNDPDQLRRAMEVQAQTRKLAGEFAKPMEYNPGSQIGPAKAGDFEALTPNEPPLPSHYDIGECKAEELPAPEPTMREISSTEWMRENNRYQRRVKVMDFADLDG